MNLLRPTIATLCLLALACTLNAQVPQTDLYLFQLTKDDTGQWHIHSPQYLSAFNQGGYTNQPEFIQDDLLYVSVRKAGDTQNDIYAMDLSTRSVARVTNTAESEFSPLRAPNNSGFSCIRQVHGDDVDQQLFLYPLDRTNNGRLIFSDIKTVGYHCWMDPDEIAMFLVGQPVSMAFGSIENDRHRIYSSNIGRSLRKTPSGHLAYIHKYSDDFWYLKSYNPETVRSEIITQAPKGREDFIIGADGDFFIGDGSVLLTFDSSSGQWIEVLDLGIFGIETITRLAMNNKNEIAIVDLKS